MSCNDNFGYAFRESLAKRLYSQYYGLEDYVHLYNTKEYLDDRMTGLPTFPEVKLWEYWQLRARYLWSEIDFRDPPKIMPIADFVGFDFPINYLYEDNKDLFPTDKWCLWVKEEDSTSITNTSTLCQTYKGSIRRILMRSIFEPNRDELKYRIEELMDIWKEPKRIAYHTGNTTIKVLKRKPNKKEIKITNWCGMEFSGKDLLIWRHQKQYNR